MHIYGIASDGVIGCDQGGELANSDDFRQTALDTNNYLVEPTGVDSMSQNGGVEQWNYSLAVNVRAILYGASLPAKYWLAAILNAVYVHNCRVRLTIKITPYEGWTD